MFESRFWSTLFLVLLLIQSALAREPKRAMVLVFDQMRPEYIERFQLPNFQRAQRLGLNFDNAIVGHLESNTIISHPVITNGKLPKNMPWASQIIKDAEGRLGPPGLFYTPFYMSHEQWFGLVQEVCGDTSIIARVKSRYPGPTLAVAQKEYAAINFGGPYADTIVCLGDVLKSGPFKGHHSVGGENVPDYISQPVGNRFYLDGVNKWGSQAERYSLKGAGYVTGNDPFRPGGDAWVGDVVEKFMEHEPDWSVIMASFGSIDKISHCLAEHDAPTKAEWALHHGIGLEDTLRKADKELGRILDRLKSLGILEETVIVITADHGGQHCSTFLGRDRPGKYNEDSYWGKGANYAFLDDPHPALVPLIKTGHLEAQTQHTMQLFWTYPMNDEEREEFEKLLSQVPGVSEAYRKLPKGDGYEYKRVYRSPDLKGRELAWAKAHAKTLADTMANLSAPEYITTLFDDTGYSLIGSNGGTQELVQRIPMIVISPNLVRAGSRSKAFTRLVDVNPMIAEAMGLKKRTDLDGTARSLKPFLKF